MPAELVAYVDSGSATIFKEDLTVFIDGVNLNFPTTVPFVPGTTAVHLNGLLQADPEDYSEGVQQVTFVDAPLPGDRLIIIYQEQI